MENKKKVASTRFYAAGSPSNIRNSTNEKIKDYHRKYYRPENMVVIVSGSVEKEKLFASLRQVEEEEAAKQREPFEKPFSEPCPPSRGSLVEKTIEYPHGKTIPVTFFPVNRE